jgi:uncharacterized membrane protein (DUF2068 family)
MKKPHLPHLPPIKDIHPIQALDSHLPQRRKLRIVAMIDLVKAVVILAAGFGILKAHSTVLENGGRTLLRLLELDPTRGAAHAFLELMHGFDQNHGVLASVAGAYAALRLAEAYGLWFGRNWARWLGLVSAGIYVPFEIVYLAKHPSAASVGVLAVNLAVLWLLWPRKNAIPLETKA